MYDSTDSYLLEVNAPEKEYGSAVGKEDLEFKMKKKKEGKNGHVGFNVDMVNLAEVSRKASEASNRSKKS